MTLCTIYKLPVTWYTIITPNPQFYQDIPKNYFAMSNNEIRWTVLDK